MVDFNYKQEKRNFIVKTQSYPHIIHCVPIVLFIQNCGRVNFSVDEWISDVTRPLDELLQILNETPDFKFIFKKATVTRRNHSNLLH